MLKINAKYKKQKITGVQRVAIELEKRLSLNAEVECVDNAYNGLLGHLYEQFILPFKLRKNDILISPINLGPIFIKNQIVIIHDVATFDHPEWFSKGFSIVYKFLLPKIAKNAKSIVTVSEYSKSRIVALFNIPPEKVTVIPNGVDERFFPNETSQDFEHEILIKEKYILSVCSIEPRKNIDRLIKAWLKSDLPKEGYQLAFAGGAGKNFSKVEAYTDPSIVWLGYVPDDALPSLYQNATAFAYASLYEGFGLPPLEAMAAGIPVLSSNTTSLPEVVGECGILVNPLSIEEITDGLQKVISLDISIITKAQNRAKMFTWESFSEKFLKVINDIKLEGNNK